MSFRLMPKLATLNDLEWRMALPCVISPNRVAFNAHYVKVVDETPILSASEM